MHFDVAVVGAGHGAAALALALRKLKYPGSIALIGDEPEPPYERPPLSKDYLAGSKSWERLLLRPLAAWQERRVTLVPSTRVVEVDPGSQVLRTAAGAEFTYGTLVWATGGSPRRLTCPGGTAERVQTIRARPDIDRIKTLLPAVDRVVVIGGGYIGLEAAAVLNKLNKQVTLLESAERVLNRVTHEPLSRFLESEHLDQGVSIELGAGIVEVLMERETAAGVRLADGRSIEAQLVIVGIGIEPNIEPLRGAGLPCTNGVRVDENCRTELPNVYAIGDCAEHQSRWAGNNWVRLESVQNANDMAVSVANSICGTETPYVAIPWFWSDQYDLRVQTIGLSRGADTAVIRGSPAERKFAVIYLRSSKVIALDCVNSPADFLQGRLLVANGSAPDQQLLADTSVPLQSLQ